MKKTFLLINHPQSPYNEYYKKRNKSLRQTFICSNNNILNNDLSIKNFRNISFAGKNQSKKFQKLLYTILKDRLLFGLQLSTARLKFNKRGKKFWQKVARIKQKMLILNSHEGIKNTLDLLKKGFADEGSLKAMLEYLKRLKLSTKSIVTPFEKEKIKINTCLALGHFSEVCENSEKPIPTWVKNRFNKEMDSLIDYYFGQKPIDLTENISTTKAMEKYDDGNICITTEIRAELKENIKIFGGNLFEAVCNLSEEYLAKTSRDIRTFGILTPGAKKQLYIGKFFNKKGIELARKFGVPSDDFSSVLNCSLIGNAERILYYEKGKLIPSQVQYEKMFLGRENPDVFLIKENNELTKAFNLFRKYGEDLGNLTKLKKEGLTNAYRRLVKKNHPDVSEADKTEADEIFKDIQEAYQTLQFIL